MTTNENETKVSKFIETHLINGKKKFVGITELTNLVENKEYIVYMKGSISFNMDKINDVKWIQIFDDATQIEAMIENKIRHIEIRQQMTDGEKLLHVKVLLGEIKL